MTQENNHSDREHRTLGGSSADRWMNCTGSIFLSKDIPPQPANDRAIKGTKTHELAEKALASMLQKKLTGEGIPGVAEEVLNYPDEDVAAWAIRYCELIWERVLGEFITGKAFGIEEKFVLSESLDMGGPADFWCVYKDDRAKRVLCIVDLKTGQHEVKMDAAQFPFYACCAREELLQNGKDIDYCRCVVVQPPLGDEIDPLTNLPNDYKEIVYTAKQLTAWKKKFLKAGEEIYVKQKPKFKTGDWCRWCPAQAKCKLYEKELAVGSSLTLVSAEDIELPAVESLEDEQLVKIITHRQKIVAYLKACAKYAITRQLSGQPLPGLKAVAGVAKRAWLSDNEIVAANLVGLGLDEESLYQKKLKGIGKIESMLKELGHKAAKVKLLLEPVTEKKATSISLVPLDDPKPALTEVGGLLGDESLNVETDEE